MKRILFNLKIWILFSLVFPSGNLLAQTDTLSFLHITDLHIIFNQNGYHPDLMEQRKQKQYDQGEPRLRQFLNTIPRITNSNMVIATGDLCDFFEASTKDGQLLDLQVEQFTQLLNDYNIPVLLTLGNHDAFSYNWHDGKLFPNQNFAGRARAAWIRNNSCFSEGTYYRKIFQVGETTYRLIFLDDIFFSFKDNETTEIPYMDRYQMYWLRDQLDESKEDIEIILMHIPFKNIPKQEEKPTELYSMLAANKSVKLILAGHFHKNSVDMIRSKENSQIVQVQTNAFASGIDNWRQINLTEDRIFVSFPGKIEYEVIIPIK